MRVDPASLVGTAEVAELLGVTAQTVSNYRIRRSLVPAFPEPVTELRCGPIWTLRQVAEWRRRRVDGRRKEARAC